MELTRLRLSTAGMSFHLQNSETIQVNENLGEFVSEKGIELYSLKEIVKQYVEETKEEETPDWYLHRRRYFEFWCGEEIAKINVFEYTNTPLDYFRRGFFA